MSVVQEARRICCVAADPGARARMAYVLRLEGFLVDEAKDVGSAIALARVAAPDALLVDVASQRHDGHGVVAVWRGRDVGDIAPIVMVVLPGDDEATRRGLEAGVAEFVTLPLAPALVAHRLTRAIDAATTERQAARTGRRLARAERIAGLAAWEHDLARGQIVWSQAAANVLGVELGERGTLAEFIGVVHGEDGRRVEAAMRTLGSHEIEYRAISADGSERVIRQDAEVVDAHTSYARLAGTLYDVTVVRRVERELEQRAHFDALTGLPNRAALQKWLGRALESGPADATMGVSVLCVDLDGFKRVNDTVGYENGDALLREVSERMVACLQLGTSTRPGPLGPLRSSQRPFLARLGGDDFVVALPPGDHDAARFARKVSDTLAGGYRFADTEVFITSSIGIARHPADGTSASDLLDRAEVAMYAAKESGSDKCQLFTPELHAKARRRLDIDSGLRAAVARACGEHDAASPPVEFHLEYQPKVEMPGERTVGVEALLRWISPTLGRVSPAEFIPVAEENGLIVKLGEWVLRTACQQANDWAEAGRALRVAVNVSARQFREADFPTTVAMVLCEVGVDPRLLELELTEGVVMEDTLACCQIVMELKDLGIRIALDDFGTGHSSLSYLARLPIDSLKVDRSFIQTIGASRSGEAVTAAIIALSRALGLSVVAEGVETAAQLAFLEPYGDMEIQGYFFAKPMRGAALEAWLEGRVEADGRKSEARLKVA